MKKVIEWFAEVCAVSFAPVFLFKMFLNNHDCIYILEPYYVVRYIEIIIAFLIIFMLTPKLYKDFKSLKGGINGTII